jgi:hypothetical protein
MGVEDTARAMGLDGWVLGRSQFPQPLSPLIAAISAPAYNAVQAPGGRTGRPAVLRGLAFPDGWAYLGPVPLDTTAGPEEQVAAVADLRIDGGTGTVQVLAG